MTVENTSYPSSALLHLLFIEKIVAPSPKSRRNRGAQITLSSHSNRLVAPGIVIYEMLIKLLGRFLRNR